MTVRHIYSWQPEATSRGWWALKRLLMELDSHLGKKLLLPGLLDELDLQDPQRNDGWTCLKVRRSFGVPASWKNLPDIMHDTEESDWQTANIGRTVFEIFCFMEKSAGYYEPIGWRWVPATLQQNFGWLSRQQNVSVNSRVLEVVCNVLPVNLGNKIICPSGVFDGVDE